MPKDFELIFKKNRSSNGEVFDKNDSVFKFKASNKEIEILKLHLTEVSKSLSFDKLQLFKEKQKEFISLLLSESSNTRINSRGYNENGFYVHYSYCVEDSGKFYNENKLFLDYYGSKNYEIRLDYTSTNIIDSISENEIEFIYKQFFKR